MQKPLNIKGDRLRYRCFLLCAIVAVLIRLVQIHLRANKRAVLAFHKQVDGLLTGSQ